jgi:hypothetical protein
MGSAFAESAHFPHRRNSDGTVDSICPRCFVTIGTSTCESDLPAIEAAHVCDPALLRYYHEQRESKRPPVRQKLPETSLRQCQPGK